MELRRRKCGKFDGPSKSLSFHVLHFRVTATHRGSHTQQISRGSSDSSGAAGLMAGKVTWRSCAACLRHCHTQRITHAATQQREQRQQRRGGFDGWQSHSASMYCMFASLPHTEDHTRSESAEGAATAAEPRVRWLAKSQSVHVLHVRVPATHRGSHTRRLSRGSSDSSGGAGLMAGKVTRRSCAACSPTCHTQRITHAATQQRERPQQRSRGFDGWQSHSAFICCMFAHLPHTEDHTRGDSAEGAATAAEPRVRWLAKSQSVHALHVCVSATHRGSHTRRLSRGSSDSCGFDGWQSHSALISCIFAYLQHTEGHTRGDSVEGAAGAAEPRV